ncbi:MAG: hypothetical protein AAF630_13115 [Cyanobacteria bacterium P01_C01_bin.38]
MSRRPNLAITTFLYVAGSLLVVLAIVLLIQAFGLFEFPQEAIYALVLLAIGAGILAAINRNS